MPEINGSELIDLAGLRKSLAAHDPEGRLASLEMMHISNWPLRSLMHCRPQESRREPKLLS